MVFFVLTRFVLVKYSRAFVERPLQSTSSLASRLTTVSLDIIYNIYIYICPDLHEIRDTGNYNDQAITYKVMQTLRLKKP